ncbi:hypothetical protein WL99_19890 [Burkholderia cepacia]|uniref:hypothetical protein n=1 Tax=Burkholderia cepacia TaxID=292 RepID=UPI00075B2718|nr:hypothetical protein [Burkholderia cepacia]KWF83460.1 hypothetical protein WL94_23815 [Burkholderia cepacia]KWH27624.1 hypothetical protein WL99_19890 [Burkholderia cepacia]
MFPFNRPRRLRPVSRFTRLYRAERRHVRRRMWTSPRLLRIEADWATRYVAQWLALSWLAWAPSLFLWAQLIANGFHLDKQIVVMPRASLAIYALTGAVVSLLYVWWRPYISYVELQVKRHMDDWYRAVCEAERSGRLY